MRATSPNPEPPIAGRTPRAGSWTLWGHDPVELHDRLWLAKGVQVVRPGARFRIRPGARWYLFVPAEEALAVLLPEHRVPRGSHRVRAMASCRTTYHEYLDFGEDRAVRSIRRLYGPNGNARPDCVLTTDAALASRLAADPGLPDRMNGSLPRAGEAPGAVLYDAGDAGECAKWLGAVADQGDDLSALLVGVRRLGPAAWGPEGIGVPASARLAGPVFLGRGVRVPDASVIVGPAVLPDGWTSTDGPFRAPEPAARPEARPTRPPKPVYECTKRVFDVVVASVLLVLAAPLMAGIAIAIRREDGSPVLFRQARQTRDGHHFDCLKFRTMVRNADELKARLREQNQADGPQFAMKNDPRILRVGHWLRRTQLDELPQLWNVIKGEMSLVGPRPSPEYENQFCPPWREARLSVPAGITGLWQVRRRREPNTDFQEWIRYDIEYAARRGWRLDLLILAQTAALFLPGRSRIGRTPKG